MVDGATARESLCGRQSKSNGFNHFVAASVLSHALQAININIDTTKTIYYLAEDRKYLEILDARHRQYSSPDSTYRLTHSTRVNNNEQPPCPAAGTTMVGRLPFAIAAFMRLPSFCPGRLYWRFALLGQGLLTVLRVSLPKGDRPPI